MTARIPPSDVTAVYLKDPKAGLLTEDWYDALRALENTATVASSQPAPKGSIYGLTLSTAGGSGAFAIAAGQASDTTGTDLMESPTAYSKSIAASWSVGSGGGSLDESSVTINRFYYAYIIKRPDTGVVDFAVSLSEIAPATGTIIPSAYTLSRLIGVMLVTAGPIIAGFRQVEDHFYYTVGIQDQNPATLGTGRSLLSLTAPPGSRALVRANGTSASAGIGFLLQPVFETHRAPGNFPSLSNEVASKSSSGDFEVPVDANSQIAATASAAASSLYVETRGWVYSRGQRNVLEGLVPTASAPSVLIRTSTNDWTIRTPIVDGDTGDYTEWLIRNINLGGNLLAMGSISTYENSVRRVQSDVNIHGSVFEHAQFVGLMIDAPSIPNWGFYGNGHNNVASTGLTIKMDAGADLSGMAVGSAVTGTSLIIEQNFNIKLPKDGVTVIGTILSDHTLNVDGCKVSSLHTISAVGIGCQNSYGMMLPLTGCNRAKFGSNPALDITPVNSGQGPNQGQNTTMQAWHTDRPDLVAELILPSGVPSSADGWSQVTTSDTFVINNTGYSKIYVNSRSGAAAVAAAGSDSHTAQYRMRKT